MAIEFEYLLKGHIQTPKDGPKWVAFTYGPWALAQKLVKGKGASTGTGEKKILAVDEPFAGKKVASKAASEWLEPCAHRQGGMPNFRIKGTGIVLEPFYGVGSLETGPRTYFKF